MQAENSEIIYCGMLFIIVLKIECDDRYLQSVGQARHIRVAEMVCFWGGFFASTLPLHAVMKVLLKEFGP